MPGSQNKPIGVEIHQLDWIPAFLKERQLESIFPILKVTRFHKKLLFLFRRLAEKTRVSEFLDLGSGAGNVVEYVVKNTDGSLVYFLSDLEPRLESYQKIKQRNSGRIDFVNHSVDMSKANGILKDRGVTLVTAFHELERDQAQNLIKNLFKLSRGFLILEPLNKSARQFLTLPLLLLSFWLVPLWTKPRKLSRYFFSWIVPVLPLFHLHDGLISFLRSYQKKDFAQMIKNSLPIGWEWEIANWGPDVTYVLAWRRLES